MTTSYWIPPQPNISAVDAFNRASLATGGARYARIAAHADYNGHRYDVIRTAYGFAAGYTWSGWNVTARGSFEECVASAARDAKRPALGSSAQCAVEALTDAQVAVLVARGFAPYTSEALEAWEAQLPWQARTEPVTAYSRVGLAHHAVRMEREQGVPATLFFEAPSKGAWDQSVADWRAEQRATRATRAMRAGGS